jgi:hypothetical protein
VSVLSVDEGTPTICDDALNAGAGKRGQDGAFAVIQQK